LIGQEFALAEAEEAFQAALEKRGLRVVVRP
jgi:hypothetical protein